MNNPNAIGAIKWETGTCKACSPGKMHFAKCKSIQNAFAKGELGIVFIPPSETTEESASQQAERITNIFSQTTPYFETAQSNLSSPKRDLFPMTIIYGLPELSDQAFNNQVKQIQSIDDIRKILEFLIKNPQPWVGPMPRPHLVFAYGDVLKTVYLALSIMQKEWRELVQVHGYNGPLEIRDQSNSSFYYHKIGVPEDDKKQTDDDSEEVSDTLTKPFKSWQININQLTKEAPQIFVTTSSSF